VLAGTASALFLVACGSDDDSGDSSATTLGLDEVDPDTPVLAAAFNPGAGYAAAGVEQRLTWSLREGNGAPLADPPATLAIALFYEGTPADAGPENEGLHEPVGEPIEVTLHDADIPIPYYPLRFTPEKAGFYSAVVTLDGNEIGASFEVSEPADVALVEPGSAMVPVETPTTDDDRGVDPICTLDPPCPFHEVTVAQALADGRPLALLISTPAFCQTDICGPVLDLVIAAAPEYPDITFVHAEVYNASEADPADPTTEGVTPAVTDYGLNFEPTLILGDAGGTLVERLDNIYDAVELRQGLDQIKPA
jgi:hypothetical protein